MSKALPELLDPARAAASGDRYGGDLPVAGFDRLAGLIEPGQGQAGGQVAYRMAFTRDEAGRDVVLGSVRAQLRLRCQRCGGPFDLPVDAEVRLALVAGIDEAEALPPEYDPLLPEGQMIRPRDLIEDELILAIPAVPRHDEGQCSVPVVATAAQRGPTPPNPFAALAGLQPGPKRDEQD